MTIANTRRSPLRIGCAGWSVPRDCAERFACQGSHLERFSRVLNAVEINSTFYSMHEPGTFERWVETTPAAFRFSVKLSQTITHELKLKRARGELKKFLLGIQPLRKKLGPLLIQLPPSLIFSPRLAESFFKLVRELHAGTAVCEPRHESWFSPEAGTLLFRHHIARVAADPALNAIAAEPGGWPGLVYFRLHGSPRRFYSSYTDSFIAALAERIAEAEKRAQVWCIFDNTASGAAAGDALRLHDRLANTRQSPRLEMLNAKNAERAKVARKNLI
ncbi:MAG TPA: DUF72 domain-containing protein [Planctomycetota bacterium]|nr:DUF72 domain-containing protein [Planctomycetota bacterium]